MTDLHIQRFIIYVTEDPNGGYQVDLSDKEVVAIYHGVMAKTPGLAALKAMQQFPACVEPMTIEKDTEC